MDVVLVGLPGSGKSVIGKRLASAPPRHVHRPRRPHRIGDRPGDPGDLRGGRRGRPSARWSARPSTRSARPTPRPGDPPGDRDGRRRRRRPAQPLGALPRPASVWLDGRPEVLAQRLRRSPHVRPLVASRDPIGTLRDLADRRERFYAAADIRAPGVAEVGSVLDDLERRLAALDPAEIGRATTLLRAETPIGRFVIGEGIAAGRRRRGAPAGIGCPGRAGLRAGRVGRGRGGARDRAGRRRLDGGDRAAAPGRGRQAAGGGRDRREPAGARSASSAASRSSRSAAARWATPPGSSPRRTCAGSRSSTSPRPSSPRSTRRSAARPGSTCRRARTCSGRSTSRSR